MSGSRPGERSRDQSEPPAQTDGRRVAPGPGAADPAPVGAQPDTGGPDPATSPVRVSMTRVVAAGMGLWAVALVLTLAVPDLRTGDRSWWPWCAAAALALGALGLGYLSLGRGNAADA